MTSENALDRPGPSEVSQTPAAKYEPPRVEKGRRLAEITGGTTAGTTVVPSGAPLPDA